MLLYRIADPGEGFDIDGLRHAAISNPDDDPIRHLSVREEQGLRPGGFGLAMTRSLVDELIYNEARNEVHLHQVPRVREDRVVTARMRIVERRIGDVTILQLVGRLELEDGDIVLARLP